MLKLPISTALALCLASSAEGQRPTPRPSIDPWEVTTSRSSVTLELAALNTASGPVFEVRPVLVVRCQDKELEVLVSTGSVLDSDDSIMTPVRVRWGSEAPAETRWSRSTDSRSAFAPDPRAFLRQLASNRDLRLEVRLSDRSPQAIHFNARGLEQHMPKVEAACPPDGRIPGEVLREDMVDERPEIVSRPPLDYPPLLRHARLQGRVVAEAVIDTLGRVEPASVRIVERPNPGFERSARDYLLHTVFRPARVQGRAVRVLVRVPIDYKIR